MGLVLCSSLSTAASLWLPQVVGQAINRYRLTGQAPLELWPSLAAIGTVVWLASSAQALLQGWSAESAARDLRRRLIERLAQQDYAYVVRATPDKLLTQLTADVEAVKPLVAELVVGTSTSLLILLGGAIQLLRLNFVLALAILAIMPLIGLAFGLSLKRLRPIFRQSRQVLDQLNRVIQESITGAAWMRVVAAGPAERARFQQPAQQAHDLGLAIVKQFAGLIPLVNVVAQLASVVILGLGGHLVWQGSLDLGALASFYGYLAMMIFPIFVLGFMSGLYGQASSAYERLQEILEPRGVPGGGEQPPLDPRPRGVPGGGEQPPLAPNWRGELEAQGLSLSLGGRRVLEDISLHCPPGSRSAVVGPTAAGKTQLVYLLSGLLQPDQGRILYDGKSQRPRGLAVVFQDSLLLDETIAVNISLGKTLPPAAWDKALETADLSGFIQSLPQGLNTRIQERGTRLSGGQKQRLMLARALAQEPTLLLLDDFTARLDVASEARILQKLRRNYPDLTLITVSQRLASVSDYEQIFLLMEGQLLAQGSHLQLLGSSPEYAQMFAAQSSTQDYEHP